jgi:hypothetical protein
MKPLSLERLSSKLQIPENVFRFLKARSHSYMDTMSITDLNNGWGNLF